ncbi:MAG: pyridoxamine 5'-phosphate oxidase family protein [Muribaculaceae bacterium]|nr:pyridoxamine 5'-phosphate oxidase family protein [Muribaculaceae bacterium]
MRRQRQQLPDDESRQILANGKECVIAVDGDDGYPYAVPLNYVYDGEYIYLHSASQGHKIDALKRNSKLSLCVIDKADIVPEEFTTYFKSVIVFGKARFIEDEDEKIEALRKLSEKYSKGIDPSDEIKRFLKVVTIIEISIDNMTGKEAIELTRQR